MIAIAFKEWAVICRALAEGWQSLILRKGGIAETGGEFRPEHNRFLHYPTYFHERHRTGVVPELLPLLDAAEADKPSHGVIRFAHYAEVAAVAHLTDPEQLNAIAPLHGWTPEEVRKRFDYRTPGLFALAVRVFRLPQTVEAVERPEYAGCKTWVELDAPIPTAGATPVLNDDGFAEVVRCLLPLAASR